MILPRNLSVTGNSNTRQINMQQIHVRNHGTETDSRNKAVAEQLEPDVQSQPLSAQARKITECRDGEKNQGLEGAGAGTENARASLLQKVLGDKTVE